MSTYAVEIRGLTKVYGQRRAVDDLDLVLPAGAVTGFVGPNGAGKTTTIRMLLGLAAPTAGSGHVLGTPLSRPRDYLRRVGALVEGPALYPSLSGRDNLRVLARLGRLDDRRVDRVLDIVGLAGRGADRVAGYSLGMRQRLGIGAALLPGPELLVLDEPTNGLDPPGIREVRELLSTLAVEGTTVLVSSHLLTELEAVADHLVLIVEGRLRFSGSTADLLSAGTPQVVLRPHRPSDLPWLAQLAAGLGLPCEEQDGRLRVSAGEAAVADLNRRAQVAGVDLVEIVPGRDALEQVFFQTLDAARTQVGA